MFHPRMRMVNACINRKAFQQRHFSNAILKRLMEVAGLTSATPPWLQLRKILDPLGRSSEAYKIWSRLIESHAQMQNCILRYFVPFTEGRPQKQIDLRSLEAQLGHSPSYKLVKSLYLQYLKFLDQSINTEVKSLLAQDPLDDAHPTSWTTYEQTVEACERSAEKSKQIIDQASKILWMSDRAPPVTEVPTHIWLESDLYWQSYLHYHHFYDPTKDVDALRSDSFEEFEAQKTQTWNRHLDQFYAASENPVNYTYIQQLHSSEYYKTYPGILILHMLYFTISTGMTKHFFPEIPSPSCIVEIEKYRYQFLKNRHARWTSHQLNQCDDNPVPLTMSPYDKLYDIAQEAEMTQFIRREELIWQAILARMMADYTFLCFPSIPCQSATELRKALALDSGHGQIIDLGDTVDAVFYIPANQTAPFQDQLVPTDSPVSLVKSWLQKTLFDSLPFDQGLADLAQIYAQILSRRGNHWFKASNESAKDAFLRRLPKQSPQYPAFVQYFEEAKILWEHHAKPVSGEVAMQKMEAIQANLNALDSELMESLEKDLDALQNGG